VTAAVKPHLVLAVGVDSERRARFGRAKQDETRFAVSRKIARRIALIELARALKLACAGEASTLVAQRRQNNPLGLRRIPDMPILPDRKSVLSRWREQSHSMKNAFVSRTSHAGPHCGLASRLTDARLALA
jgi:hypothetical protein